MALFPEDSTLQAWTSISEAREFSGLSVAFFKALQARLGTLDDALRNFAILPAEFLDRKRLLQRVFRMRTSDS